MNFLDGTYDGGGDGFDDRHFDPRDEDYDGGGQDYDGEGEDDFERRVHDDDEFPQSEYGQAHDDADFFEGHQLALDREDD